MIHTIDLHFQGRTHAIAAFVVESQQGPILIETGPHSTIKHLDAGIRTLGFDPMKIKHVLVTHIHLDHAGAAWVFAERGADIYVHPFGLRHMVDPSRLLASANMIYGDKMDELWGTLKPIPADQIHAMEHGQTLAIAEHQFIAHHTPGHAKHHIAWQLGKVLFAGDVAGVCINGGPVIPPCPPPDINIELWLTSIEQLLALSEVDRYYLTHFGEIGRVDEHMDKLKKSLAAYANVIKPHHQAGRTLEEALPSFKSFVKNYLVEHGMAEADAQTYEASNPSDMSVTGLMRYWQKKSAGTL